MSRNPTLPWILAPLLCTGLLWSAASSHNDGGSWAVEEPAAKNQISNTHGQPVQSKVGGQPVSRPRQPIQSHLPTTHVSSQMYWHVRIIGPDQY